MSYSQLNDFSHTISILPQHFYEKHFLALNTNMTFSIKLFHQTQLDNLLKNVSTILYLAKARHCIHVAETNHCKCKRFPQNRLSAEMNVCFHLGWTE